ncbi:MAG TPA: 3-deoxy-7-phosphoheptulonate synthase [Flavobacteriales bacterium]|jgi:chorismate mutase|nr:3-deoxy-7-phosphoheptulonate synthase [Flavobacteriales bacterium]
MTTELKILSLKAWFPFEGDKLIIAGPCSAETKNQTLQTASALKDIKKVHLFRAGLWKPRTRPGSFEGIGETGLNWMSEVKKTTHMPITVEVANAGHVEKALANNVDVLWIGARTTANPFSVQEIADALSGVDIPVMIKNPINPDLSLWVGALERINGSGINRLIAIHRGFSTHHEEYRNAPHWEIPLKLKTLIPPLPILCDPSHIAGSRKHLFQIAQKAMDLDMDGLMIESHINPDEALSDPKQQIKPSDLADFLENLELRSSTSSDVSYLTELEELRSKIDDLDRSIIELVSQRMDISSSIGDFKLDHNVTVFQLERWKEILETRVPLGASKGLKDAFIEELMQLIHDESIKIQLTRFR